MSITNWCCDSMTIHSFKRPENIQVKCPLHLGKRLLSVPIEFLTSIKDLESYLDRAVFKTYEMAGRQLCRQLAKLRGHTSDEYVEKLYNEKMSRFLSPDSEDDPDSDGDDPYPDSDRYRDSDKGEVKRRSPRLLGKRKTWEEGLPNVTCSAKSRTNYPVNKAADNPVKLEINQVFVRRAITAASSIPGGLIVYLDGPACITTNHFMEQDVPSHVSLVIPNMPDYSGVLDTIRENNWHTRVQVKESWLNEYIESLKGNVPITAIWADYQGILLGSREKESKGLSSPFQDVKMLFGCNLLKTGSVFAITLCSRGDKEFVKKDKIVKESRSFLEKEAASAGLKLHLDCERSYDTMYFFLYIVEQVVSTSCRVQDDETLAKRMEAVVAKYEAILAKQEAIVAKQSAIADKQDKLYHLLETRSREFKRLRV